MTPATSNNAPQTSSQGSFQQFCHEAKVLIDQRLQDFIGQQPVPAQQLESLTLLNKPEAAQEFNNKKQILSRLSQFITAGKTIRGCLVLLGYHLWGNDNGEREASLPRLELDATTPESVIKVALATELVHSALLMQDDIMDQDQLRRGLPAMHKQCQHWASHLFEQDNNATLDNPAQLYGYSLTICLSDLLFFWAFNLLSQLDIGLKEQRSLVTQFNQMITDTIWGQVDDVTLAMKLQAGSLQQQQPAAAPLNQAGPSRQSTPAPGMLHSQEQILNIYRLKTARYTLCNPLLSGARLARAKPKQLQLLEDFAQNLGLVFQIQDDSLTFFADEAAMGQTAQVGQAAGQVGKALGNDIQENKATLHRLLLFQAVQASGNQDEWQQLKSAFGNQQLTQDQFEQVQRLAQKYQLKTKITDIKVRYLDQAHEALKQLKAAGLSDEHQSMLRELMLYLNLRQN
jgi:geranylgeranyl diphosphate synthase type I